MERTIIRWKRNYHEDLGTQDEDGFYDYAYCYFIYEFKISKKEVVTVRQYTDTAYKCSLFVRIDELLANSDDASKEKIKAISAIIDFLRADFEIKEFYFLKRIYELIDLSRLSHDPAAFGFEEM